MSPDEPEVHIPADLGKLVEFLARRMHSDSGDESSWDALHEVNRQRLINDAERTLRIITEAGFRVRRSEKKRQIDAEIEEAMRTGDDGAAAGPIALAEHFIHAGEPLLAFNEVQEALKSWPANTRLRQLLGISLARSGALHRASEVLQALLDEGADDGETEGPLARTHKDLGLTATDESERQRHLGIAFDLYEDAYQKANRIGRVADAYYTGINAATMALLLGRRPRARMLAEHVRQLCNSQLSRAADDIDSYWIHATLAEAALINGAIPLSEMHYRKAASLARTRYGDLGSTRKQARLLLAHMQEDAQWLEDVLAIPPVLIYVGRMIDVPGRAVARFDPSLEPVVADRIRSHVAEIKPVAAYGSAASGTDILCLEAALEFGGEIHVTLPFPAEEFVETSVAQSGEGNWEERFNKILEAAESVTIASDHRASGSTAPFEYANLIFTGLAELRRRALGTSLRGLTVWDGRDGDGVGGTASAVRIWRALGLPFEQIDPVALAPSGGEEQSVIPDDEPADDRPHPGFRHEIKSMLFADAVGYSKLSEDQVPIFIEQFLGSVATLNEKTASKPIHIETAGDGLYMVFASIADAAHYALELKEMVRDRDWVEAGLPEDMEIRVGLHCGPVFCGTDPITGLEMYTGPHTSRTARIEPVTPPGQVYASSAFAAAAVAQGVNDLKFRYMGQTPLAKKYGKLALYHVRRGKQSTADVEPAVTDS